VCPAKKLPDDLQRSLNLINQFMLDPIDLAGKKALQMVSKVNSSTKSKPRRTRGGGDYDMLGDDFDEEDEEGRARRGEARGKKKKKEKEDTLSRQFIEDSDAEIGDDDAFFAAEAELRKKMIQAAESNVPVQGAGTKKKKRKKVDRVGEGEGGEGESDEGVRKRPRKSMDMDRPVANTKGPSAAVKKGIAMFDDPSDEEDGSASDSPQRKSVASSPPTSRAASDDDEDDNEPSQTNVRLQRKTIGKSSGPVLDSDEEEEEAPVRSNNAHAPAAGRTIKKLVLSDEEEE
jgi:replication fork protection complex subunit Tof1/Swi1